MKKLFTSILSIVMCISMIPSAAAIENSIPIETEPFVVDLSVFPAEKSSRMLSKDEVIAVLMESRNISATEAAGLLYDGPSDPNITLEERKIVYTLGAGFALELGCLVWVHCGGGHCNFGEIEETWVTEFGSGNFTWVPSYDHITVEGPYDNQIRFRARGYFQVEVTSETSTGFTAEICDIGFEMSYSEGSTYYYRCNVSVDEVWP